MTKMQEWIDAVERARNRALNDAGEDSCGRENCPECKDWADQAARLTELAAYLRDDGWQPIEGCPNDGTLVMYHVPGKRIPPIGRGDDYHSGMAVYLDGVTHYRPLPAPPEQGEG